MRILSKKLEKMPRSGIRVIMDLAAQQKEVFHLELGEPGFQTPTHIQEAAIRAMEEGFTKYTANPGLLTLREIVLEKVKKENRIAADLEQIAITPGSMFALASAMMAIVEPGEEILIPDPGWPNYYMQAVILGLKPVFYPLREEYGFQPRVEEIEPLMGPRTRAILVNSPSNPTGAVYTEETVKGLIDLVTRHDIYMISDEVYERIIFNGHHLSPATFDPEDRVIPIYGLSKTYAMTGWRVGYYVAPKKIATQMHKLIEPFVACTPSISQKAAEAAISGPQDCVDEMVRAYRERRDLVVEVLTREGFDFCTPEGAFYLLVRIDKAGMESYDFAKELVQETGVAVAPGTTFGPSAASYVRMSFCAKLEEIEEGLRRFCRFFHEKSQT
jgi:aspartate aminotransferase/aminotransferase